MAELKNEFTWSKSRADKFNECPRAYYYHYYGSWGGWDETSPPEARELYILKNLSSRFAWSGKVVHDTIAFLLKNLKSTGTLIPVEEAVPRARAMMIDQWRNSIAKLYRNSPKSFGMFEHEYSINVTRDRWKDIYNNVEQCLKNFYASEIFATIRSTDPARWLPIEQLDRFDFEGTPVWVVMDFAMQGPDGEITIVDWKTGRRGKSMDMIQLLCYGLYAHTTWDVPIERVKCHLQYLSTNETEVCTVNSTNIETVKRVMQQSISQMKNLLRDPVENMAVEEDFKKITNDRPCFWCNFRKVCKPHL
jgi:hypothetical protein